MRRGYEIDHAGIIHLAIRDKNYTNAFRLSAALTEPVRPAVLQAALKITAPGFPTIVAGIRRREGRYQVIPVNKEPQVQPDQKCLASMSEKRIETCALRVLYGKQHIAVEIFHSLTDGCGGMAFFKALLQSYLSLAHGNRYFGRTAAHFAGEVKDDYVTYAAGTAASAGARKYYCPSGTAPPDAPVQVTTAAFDLAQMLCAAHRFQVSLTAFLTAALETAIAESQPAEKRCPVQIMIPVNLRRKFASRTLRNFSLYALPTLEPNQMNLPFQQIAEETERQLAEQTSQEALAAAMASSVWMQDMPLMRLVPLGVKETVLRMGYGLVETSFLTLSNLGEVTFPPQVTPYIQDVEFTLTPRKRTQYNCSVLSYNGKLNITISRKGKMAAWEKRFWRCLGDMGCHAVWKVRD